MEYEIPLSRFAGRHKEKMPGFVDANLRFGRCANFVGRGVRADHIDMHIEYPPKLALSELVKRLKGRSSRILQMEYPKLKERYWGKHFWAIGYGA